MEAYNCTGYYEYHPPRIEYSKNLVQIAAFTHEPTTPQELQSCQNSILFEELFELADIFGSDFKFIDYCDFMKSSQKNKMRMLGVDIHSKINGASANLFIYYNSLTNKPCLRMMNQWSIYDKILECKIKGHEIIFSPRYVDGDWTIMGYTRIINGKLVN